jgi:hypothetical protein
MLMVLAALAIFTTLLMADEDIPTEEPESVISRTATSRMHFLFQTEFASGYTTPRGMIVRNHGLTIQPLLLAFVDLYKGGGFINNVVALAGVWNDLGTSGVSKHPPFGSHPKTIWTEIDPMGGISIGFAKYLTLDVTYITFVEQILDIPTAQNLETKLRFDDSDFLGAFAIHPQLLYWQELVNKSTDADVPYEVLGPSPKSGSNPHPGESFYFELGVAPSYTFRQAADLKIEAPSRLLLPNSKFYGEYYGNSSTVGLFELGLKASVPLTFMPKDYGNWGTYAGLKYQYYNDKNLYNLNTFNAPGGPTRDNLVFYTGISVFL